MVVYFSNIKLLRIYTINWLVEKHLDFVKSIYIIWLHSLASFILWCI